MTIDMQNTAQPNEKIINFAEILFVLGMMLVFGFIFESPLSRFTGMGGEITRA